MLSRSSSRSRNLIYGYLRRNSSLRRSSTDTASAVEDYDVLISGGGVVGSSFAAKLLKESQGTLKIVLLDQKPPLFLEACNTPVPDFRVYALSPKTIRILKDLDAWQYVEPRSQPYNKMQIWEEEGNGLLTFNASDAEVLELGRIAEDRCIQSSLFQVLQQSEFKSSLDLMFGCSITDLHVPKSGGSASGPAEVTVQMADKSIKKIRAR